MPKKRTTRIYQRGDRYWADFRDYVDVGGRQEALVPIGMTRATDDLDVAEQVLGERLTELQQLRVVRHATGLRRVATLADFADQHLREKAQTEDVTDGWLVESENRLNAAVEYFGADRPLTSIRPSDVKKWLTWLKKEKKGKGGKVISSGTLRHYLNALSNLYGTAQEHEVVTTGFNPVAALKKKPQGKPGEPKWFEVHDASLIVEAARLYEPQRSDVANHFTFPLVATLLLTGGRRAEVLGLEVSDISFDRKTVTFRSNDWRRLKTDMSQRVIPLWPQLAEVLEEYLATVPPQRLLFPSNVNGGEQVVQDIEKQFDSLAKTLGMARASIRCQMLRKTYCAARLQTLDNGQPISIFTVARELGHTSIELVKKIYGHLGTVRHRAEVVEYHANDFKEELGDRLAALQAMAR